MLQSLIVKWALFRSLYATVQVKSNTVQGNRHHSREHVIANIIKSNIPVANGIVHLIDRPLIVVASPLWKYLEEEVWHLSSVYPCVFGGFFLLLLP